MAALGDNLLVTGRSNITVQADTLLDQLDIGAFDLLFLPGGPGVKGMREDGRPPLSRATLPRRENRDRHLCGADHFARCWIARRQGIHLSLFGAQ